MSPSTAILATIVREGPYSWEYKDRWLPFRIGFYFQSTEGGKDGSKTRLCTPGGQTLCMSFLVNVVFWEL